ncbi:hypothetical protein VTL71DRAFT_12086 [Oculimacula yallundae]|uniref:BTB domain-containing protein n=1 Tax=Oculimacula yallundae TaxID=86028 RepID=A0ABR4CTQ3_9HELO
MAPPPTRATSSASTISGGSVRKKVKGDSVSFDSPGMSELVTFIIGPTKKKFLIHKRFACEASPVLRTAFNGSFVEGQTQEYALADTTEDAFALLAQWVYADRIEIDYESFAEDKNKDKASTLQAKLMELWLLADRFLIPQLQNIAISLLYESQTKLNWFTLRSLNRVWEQTSTDTKLRLFILEFCIFWLNKQVFRVCGKWFPKEMLLELAYLTKQNTEDKVTEMAPIEGFYVPEESV